MVHPRWRARDTYSSEKVWNEGVVVGFSGLSGCEARWMSISGWEAKDLEQKGQVISVWGGGGVRTEGWRTEGWRREGWRTEE